MRRMDFSRVHLPSIDGVLLPASELAYIDSISSAIIVDRIGTDAIHLAHPGIPQDACEKLKVIPVSSCFQEVVVSNPLPAPAASQGRAEVERLCLSLAREECIQNLTTILSMMGFRGITSVSDTRQLTQRFSEAVRPVCRIETRIQPSSIHQSDTHIPCPATCSVSFHFDGSNVLIATDVDEGPDSKHRIVQAFVCALSHYLGSVVPLPIEPLIAFLGSDSLSTYQVS